MTVCHDRMPCAAYHAPQLPVVPGGDCAHLFPALVAPFHPKRRGLTHRTSLLIPGPLGPPSPCTQREKPVGQDSPWASLKLSPHQGSVYKLRQ